MKLVRSLPVVSVDDFWLGVNQPHITYDQANEACHCLATKLIPLLLRPVAPFNNVQATICFPGNTQQPQPQRGQIQPQQSRVPKTQSPGRSLSKGSLPRIHRRNAQRNPLASDPGDRELSGYRRPEKLPRQSKFSLDSNTSGEVAESSKTSRSSAWKSSAFRKKGVEIGAKGICPGKKNVPAAIPEDDVVSLVPRATNLSPEDLLPNVRSRCGNCPTDLHSSAEGGRHMLRVSLSSHNYLVIGAEDKKGFHASRWELFPKEGLNNIQTGPWKQFSSARCKLIYEGTTRWKDVEKYGRFLAHES